MAPRDRWTRVIVAPVTAASVRINFGMSQKQPSHRAARFDLSSDDRVKDHYEDPYNQGPVDDATHSGEVASPVSEDRVRIAVRIERGVIEEAGFEAEGGVIPLAAASMLCEAVEGKTIDEAKQFSAEDMITLFGERLRPEQQKYCLLPWRCFQAALDLPLAADEDDETASDSPGFGGPSLSEES